MIYFKQAVADLNFSAKTNMNVIHNVLTFTGSLRSRGAVCCTLQIRKGK